MTSCVSVIEGTSGLSRLQLPDATAPMNDFNVATVNTGLSHYYGSQILILCYGLLSYYFGYEIMPQSQVSI